MFTVMRLAMMPKQRRWKFVERSSCRQGSSCRRKHLKRRNAVRLLGVSAISALQSPLMCLTSHLERPVLAGQLRQIGPQRNAKLWLGARPWQDQDGGRRARYKDRWGAG